jgi:Protein of unknown function (DUF732)
MWKSIAVALTASAIGFAAPAHAALGDESFVQQLHDAGINLSEPPSLVGNTARSICGLLKTGTWTVATTSYSVAAEYPELSESQDRQFVIIAQRNYCPDI